MDEKAKGPAIRFKGFTEDWEQRKLGKIVDKYEYPVLTPRNGYTRLGIRSHTKGTFHSYVEKGSEPKTAQMHKVAAGNFIVNITFGWEHAVAITDESDSGKLVSHRFPQFQFREGMVPEFFKYVIIDEGFRHHLWVSSPGGAGRNRVLKVNEMLDYPMIYPCEKEQTEIGLFFCNLSNLITLHQRKLLKLKNIKKAMLEKMFPKSGRNVPEIRFAGFTDAWKQRKVSEIANLYYGGGTPSTLKEEYWHGVIPWIQSSDIAEDDVLNVSPRKFISQQAVNHSAVKIVPDESIAVITRVGVGKLAFMPFSYTTSQDFLSLSKLNVDGHFAVYSLYRKLQNDLNMVQGTSIKGITKEELLAKEIAVPEIHEQIQIGSHFRKLDSLITLHQHRIKKLQNIKKAFLEKMFI